MRLPAPVLSTGLTAVDSGMPLNAMLLVVVPWGAVIATVAVCLVAAVAFPLVVGVLRVLAGPVGVARCISARVSVLAGVRVGGVVVVAVCLVAAFALPLVVGVLRVLAGPIKAVCRGVACVSVLPRG
jgi:hypothetical protein